MEEVLADWSATAVGSIVLAAVSAVVTMRAFLGNEPLFRIPAFEIASASELLVYAGIGLVSGALSALFIRLIEEMKRRIEHLPNWKAYGLPSGGRFPDRCRRSLVSRGDGRRLRGNQQRLAWTVHVGRASLYRSRQALRDVAVLQCGNAGWHVRTGAFHRSDAGRSTGRIRPPLLAVRRRARRILHSRRHGDLFCRCLPVARSLRSSWCSKRAPAT